MTQKERQELLEKGLDMIYPDGRWLCKNPDHSSSFWVAKNEKCGVCGNEENIIT